MNTRLLAKNSISRDDRNHPTLGLPKEVDEHLGQPDAIVWMLDEDTGLVYAVPPSEVTLR